MSLSLHLIRIMKENEPVIDGLEDKVVDPSPRKPVGEVIKPKVGLSPNSIRRNVSNDNFLKFQWPWTV